MNIHHRKSPIVLLVLLFGTLPAMAGTVNGVVRNGTSGTVVAGQEVVLMQLQGGMETVATAITDAQGRFTLDHPSIGQGPVLVRVNYRGVNFHQAVPPGRNVADVEVFEPTTDPKAFEVSSRIIVFQPDGASLLVGEEYTIDNHSKPPAAFFKADGTFEFEVPDGAQLGQVAAWGPSAMPVTQGTMERGKNRYAIAFPFRPGENGIRLAYQIPYATNRATVQAASPYPTRRVSLIAPPTMQIEAAGFSLVGQDQGWNVYTRETLAARAALEVSVSGTAPPLSASDAQNSGGQTTGATGQPLSQLPGRLDSLKVPLLAGLGTVFGLGVLFLWRRPVAGATGASPSAARATDPSAAVVGANGLAEMDRQVGQSLDAIKDTLFRLELRRQAGTISEEEYSRERARAEHTLRDLVKG